MPRDGRRDTVIAADVVASMVDGSEQLVEHQRRMISITQEECACRNGRRNNGHASHAL